jgi:hypothetical protein
MARRVMSLALLYTLIVVMAPSDADGVVTSGVPPLYSPSPEAANYGSIFGHEITIQQRQLVLACLSKVQ